MNTNAASASILLTLYFPTLFFSLELRRPLDIDRRKGSSVSVKAALPCCPRIYSVLTSTSANFEPFEKQAAECCRNLKPRYTSIYQTARLYCPQPLLRSTYLALLVSSAHSRRAVLVSSAALPDGQRLANKETRLVVIRRRLQIKGLENGSNCLTPPIVNVLGTTTGAITKSSRGKRTRTHRLTKDASLLCLPEARCI
ncbi:hypothetical protein DFH11DRAFT_1615200 [Phellopilus nigrolimitatus]|nr:hypothetical protein DFH11DRAFT_1615200 [Phellopilus nigrolimitatus]